MSTRRLCMVVHGPYPLGEPRVEREALAARDAGWDVEVIATSTPGTAATELLEGIRVRRLPITHRRGGSVRSVITEYILFTLLAAGVVLRRSRPRFDVVQVHNPPDFLFLAAVLPKLLGSATIFDVHDFSPEMFTMRLGERPLAKHAERLLCRIERAAARLADAVVTVHEPYRRELVERGVPARKLLTVMNTLDERHMPAATDQTPPKKPRIVTHGTITAHYGLDLLVEATRQVRANGHDVSVEIYGDGDALPALQSQIAGSNLERACHVEGQYLPLPEVLERLAGAQVGVVCNRPIERNLLAVPTKLFEYVAMGIPVVSADLPAVREHFSDDEIQFFPAGNADALGAALESTLSDPDAARQRAARASQRYANYRWPVSARRYTDLLAVLSGTQ